MCSPKCWWRRLADKAESWWIENAPFAVVENPFELFIALLCIVAGIPYITGQVKPTTLEALMPKSAVLLWGISLAIGGVLVATGLLKRDIYLEKAGLWPLSIASFLYAVSLAALFGIRAILACLVILAFSVASWSRLILLRAVLRIPPMERRNDGADAR